MSRAEVLKLIGAPESEVGKSAYYGERPKYGSLQSPQSPNRVVLTYSADGVVESKQFFPDRE
jgi:hypothetical protein